MTAPDVGVDRRFNRSLWKHEVRSKGASSLQRISEFPRAARRADQSIGKLGAQALGESNATIS